MDISLRDLLDCVDADLDQDQSVLFRLFGFRRGLVPPDPEEPASVSDEPAEVSVRQLAGDLDGDHIDLNVIDVGFDQFTDNGLASAEIELDYCVYRIRNIFRTRGVGVGRIRHYSLDSNDAGSFGSVDDADEAEDLWRSFYVDNDGVDAFVSRFVDRNELLGLSPVGGNCDKQSKNNGLFAGGANDDAEGLSRTFAHEVGHFLGLKHNHDALPDGSCPTSETGQLNLMAQTGCIPTVSGSRDTRGAVLLTSRQGNDMDDHCTIQEGC